MRANDLWTKRVKNFWNQRKKRILQFNENCTRKFTFVDIFNYDIFFSPLLIPPARSLFKFISMAQSIFLWKVITVTCNVPQPNTNVAVVNTRSMNEWIHLCGVCVSLCQCLYGVCVCCMALNHMLQTSVICVRRNKVL